MAKLYLEEYRKSLSGKTVLIACREGILRNHLQNIINDIKFLNRQGIETLLCHNLANRFANQKLITFLDERLPETRKVRLPPEADFYTRILTFPGRVDKIILLERKYLIDTRGRKVNAISTQTARRHFDAFGDVIANVNFKCVLEKICNRIESGAVDRVHILPAGKGVIKGELFTIEGSGTLIANNFTETAEPVETDADVDLVSGILKQARKEGFIKPRSRDYVSLHRDRFLVARIDTIVVGCAEAIPLDAITIELGALAISSRFRNHRIGRLLIDRFTLQAMAEGRQRIVSLTNHPTLQSLYRRMGFSPCPPDVCNARQERSPGVSMFILSL